MSSESQEVPEPTRPEVFSPEGWEKLSDSERRQVVEYEKLVADGKFPSWWDTRVTVVLSLDEDSRLVGETLDAAGVPCSIISGQGMAWVDVPANERERALLCLQSEPRLGGRIIDLQRCPSDQAYREVNRIPRRVDTWPRLPGDQR